MTNNLTTDMARLVGEIAALRDSRASLMSNLAEFRAETQATVAGMLADFTEARSDMAAQTKADLSGFIVRIQDAVTELRQEIAQVREGFREDLAGAHQAWHGAPSAPRPAAARPAPAPAPESPFTAPEEPAGELPPKAKRKKR
jgi:hypothetical protein